VTELWTVLVPATYPDGQEIDVFTHRLWDERVRTLVGGLTIMKPVKGEWVSLDGDIFREQMIPVLVACTEDQLDQVIGLVAEFYQQQAVMAYRTSDKCKIVHFG
jgi:hypothetical protein